MARIQKITKEDARRYLSALQREVEAGERLEKGVDEEKVLNIYVVLLFSGREE